MTSNPTIFEKAIGGSALYDADLRKLTGKTAPELIAEYVLAMNMEGSIDEVHRSIHAHPTLSEALMEAAAATTGEAIHI